MATAQLSGVVRQLRAAAFAGANMTDGQLLECYLARNDEAAFAVLVRRLGPMVLGVCQRVLGNTADAEDAFQATFLVLVRKATVIRPRERIGVWLYGVAYRTALKARCTAAKRRYQEAQLARSEAVPATPPDDWRAVLDQELQRLPEKYRTAILLCDLEGKTRKATMRPSATAPCRNMSRSGRPKSSASGPAPSSRNPIGFRDLGPSKGLIAYGVRQKPCLRFAPALSSDLPRGKTQDAAGAKRKRAPLPIIP